jgi:WS/DGAT/MGAT family acyltransferase
VDEQNFDADHHVRAITISTPGDERQVLDLIALLDPLPFEPERSPWDVTVIDGLRDGRGAVYLRAHHVLTDSIGGVSLIRLLLDETPAADALPELRSTTADMEQATRAGRRPGTVTIDLARPLRPFASGIYAALRFEPTDLTDAVVRGVQRGLDVAESVSRQVLIIDGPGSSLPSSRSMSSYFDLFSVSGARAASLALGGSRNDLLVAAAAGGLGLYHERLGQPCAELRLATPTSLRHNYEVGGNWFAPTRVQVPTAVEHPGPQFGVVAERLGRVRREPAVQLTSAVASTIGRLPTRLLVAAVQAQARSVDFAATTLPGFHGQRHICGALIERCYPFGPRLGCPVNISAFGNDDRLDVGIALDPSAITEPKIALECFATAFERFVAQRADTDHEQPPTSRSTD